MNELHFPAVSVPRARASGLHPAAGRDGVGRASLSPTLRGIVADTPALGDPGSAWPAAAAARADFEPDGPPVGTSRRRFPVSPHPVGPQFLAAAVGRDGEGLGDGGGGLGTEGVLPGSWLRCPRDARCARARRLCRRRTARAHTYSHDGAARPHALTARRLGEL